MKLNQAETLAPAEGTGEVKRRRRNKDGTLTKVMLAEQVRFAERTAVALLELGARQIRSAYRNGPGALCVSAGDFELDTIAGVLEVHAFGDWIAARFKDAERGAAVTGHCGYYGRASALSGKWNLHAFDVGIMHEEEDKEGRVLTEFLRRVRPILLFSDAERRARAKYDGHRVELADLGCQYSTLRPEGFESCERPAKLSLHTRWDTGNTKGISFFYGCEEHFAELMLRVVEDESRY